MANYTPNYNLKKPAQDDFFDVDDFNENADKIDTALNGKLNTDFSNISGGAIAIANGGTGATTASGALANLGVNTALSNKADKDLSNVTGTLPVSKGGTGAITASSALSNLGAFSSSGGTIAGDVKLKTSSSNYGCALTFGDGTNVQSITSGTTTNQKTVFNSDGTIADACRKIYVQSSTPSNAPDGSLWAW